MLPLPANPPAPSVASLRRGPGDADSLARYWRFYWALAAAQLATWLPARPSRILDISGGQAAGAAQAAAAGHAVLRVLDPHAPHGPHGPHAPHGFPPAQGPQRRPREVIADAAMLRFLADGCLDAVIAEDRVLSRHLVTEATLAEIARVLRPGGRALLCVDSLMLGMAILAEQNYWAHLSYVPSADVVLIPWPDGTITRCFWTDQLRELLAEAGMEAEWIRPRTVLSPSTVEHVLRVSPRSLSRLVRTELAAPVTDESVGIHLVASARRR